MITRALDAGVPAAWVAGNEVYGQDPDLRAELEERRTGYVLAVACHHQVTVAAGKCRVDELPACLPRTAWQRYSAGPGAKGHRYYDWALIGLPARPSDHHWLLIRRSRRTGELAFYRCYAPRPVPLVTLVQVAGTRWTVEENFQAGKELAGLDQHQVRRWASWYRWVTLAMLAAAFLTITAAAEHSRPQPDDQIPLTRNEISHLLTATIIRPATHADPLTWSSWRRRHQRRARTSHYRRQATAEQ
jgi:SRSO17 transposase